MAPLRHKELDFESLFEAVVQPVLPPEQKRRRIDGVVASALGRTSRLLPKGTEFAAFGGVQEPVLRGAIGSYGAVVVEGVNLAGANARKDADALVSRLLRIKAVSSAIVLRVVVGYIASPGGLNGETDMRDWIRERVTTDVFDLASEETLFQSAAQAGLDGTGIQGDSRPTT
jgi:hypothetical protein